jgi:hypothetical protein
MEMQTLQFSLQAAILIIAQERYRAIEIADLGQKVCTIIHNLIIIDSLSNP